MVCVCSLCLIGSTCGFVVAAVKLVVHFCLVPTHTSDPAESGWKWPCSEHWMLAGCLSPFCAVNQVLGHFRDRFITEVDASTIVFELESKGIIPNGVLTAVNEKRDATIQNQILFAHLEKTSTKDSLVTVCEVIIAVPGNPRMRALGEDMKSKLLCKLCASSIHAYTSARVHV